MPYQAAMPGNMFPTSGQFGMGNFNPNFGGQGRSNLFMEMLKHGGFVDPTNAIQGANREIQYNTNSLFNQAQTKMGANGMTGGSMAGGIMGDLARTASTQAADIDSKYAYDAAKTNQEWMMKLLQMGYGDGTSRLPGTDAGNARNYNANPTPPSQYRAQPGNSFTGRSDYYSGGGGDGLDREIAMREKSNRLFALEHPTYSAGPYATDLDRQIAEQEKKNQLYALQGSYNGEAASNSGGGGGFGRSRGPDTLSEWVWNGHQWVKNPYYKPGQRPGGIGQG